MKLWLGLGLSVGLLALAAPVTAQERTHRLQDGRLLALAADTAPCGEPTPQDDARYAIVVNFQCRDAASGVGGDGFLAVGQAPGETTPRDYLAEIAAEYRPDLSAEVRDREIVAATFDLEGRESRFLCLSGSDLARDRAETTCVLDQPKTQVIVHGRSGNVEQAYGVVLMILFGVTIGEAPSQGR
jgi:hypothetical protein